jgi:outer membrane protein TolC
LRAGFARLRQAIAIADAAGAPRLPQVSAQLQAGRQKLLIGDFGAREFNTFSASIPVSYEVDLFDRLGSEAQAASMSAGASRDDVETMAMSLAAQVAEAWYGVVQARALKQLLHQQLELNQTFLELVTLRFRQGLASALDVHQQRQQLVRTRAQIALVDAQEAVASNQLSLLTGQAPGGRH